MSNNMLETLVQNLYDVRRQKADLEKLDKVIVAELKPLVDPKFDALPDRPIVVDDIALTRIAGVSRTIDADLLLERGVAPDIIQYATKTSNYYRYLAARPGDRKKPARGKGRG